jgi:hypothetical protein
MLEQRMTPRAISSLGAALPVVGAAILGFVLLGNGAGCSDDELPPRQPTGVIPGVGGMAGGGGSDGGGGGGEGPGGAGGNVIADTDCAAPGAAGVEVYADTDGLRLEQLEAVGSRWIASSSEGYVFFNGDGENADGAAQQLAPNFNVIVSEGATAGIAASGPGFIQFVRVDEQDMTIAGPLGVALESPEALALASEGGDTVVVWAYNTTLKARPVNSGGVLGAAVDVAFGAYSTFVEVVAAARSGSVGIAWSGDPDLGANVSQFTLIEAGGVVGDSVRLLETVGAHSVAGIVATDAGFAVLFTGEPPANEPLVMTLDAQGEPTSEIWRLQGARYAHDLASLGDGFAVLAGRGSGEAQMRSFDLTLQPAADWVCLGADHDDSRPPAVAVDGTGYATLHTTLAGAVMLHRLDHLGTGAP